MPAETPRSAEVSTETIEEKEYVSKVLCDELMQLLRRQNIATASQVREEVDLSKHKSKTSDYYKDKASIDAWEYIKDKLDKTLSPERQQLLRDKYVGGETLEEFSQNVLTYTPHKGERIIFCKRCPTIWLHIDGQKLYGEGDAIASPNQFTDFREATVWLYSQLDLFHKTTACTFADLKSAEEQKLARDNRSAEIEFDRLSGDEKAKRNRKLGIEIGSAIEMSRISDEEAREALKWSKDTPQYKAKLMALLTRESIVASLKEHEGMSKYLSAIRGRTGFDIKMDNPASIVTLKANEYMNLTSLHWEVEIKNGTIFYTNDTKHGFAAVPYNKDVQYTVMKIYECIWDDYAHEKLGR